MELIAFDYLVDSNKRIFYIYIVSSLMMTIIYLWNNQKQKRVLLSSKLWLHESAQLDYVYFFVNVYIKVLIILPLVVSVKYITLFVYQNCIVLFGYVSYSLSYEKVVILYTLVMFLISDFTRYVLHRLMHAVPFFWEFHKVHHSAKVLTPLTFYRVHPLENLLFGFRYALSIGLVTGIFFYFFGAVLNLYTILGVNSIVFVFNVFGSNLRHTHVKIKYSTFLENILISPYQHQIHHSRQYLNKNYGGYLAVWDYLFHSLKKSNEVGVIKFGLNKQSMHQYKNVLDLLLTPFKNCIKKRRKNEKYEVYTWNTFNSK